MKKYLSALIIAVMTLTMSTDSFAKKQTLEDATLSFMQSPTASYAEAKNVVATFIKDGRPYEIKSAAFFNVINEYASTHPDDKELSSKARRLGNEALTEFKSRKETSYDPVGQAAGKKVRALSAVAFGSLALAVTIPMFMYQNAPEIVWAPAVSAIVGWFTAWDFAGYIFKRIPLLRPDLSPEDADLMVNKTSDFLSHSTFCKVNMEQ